MSEPTGRLANRRIALGITGSIAAYKSVELLRLLQAEGADIRVLMTTAAVEFVGTLTLETLSHHAVESDVLALSSDGAIGHVETGQDAEAILVAPATAHWIAAMANGLAADTITAACLATSVPVIVAPAMDGGMYSHPATQANVARLREFGYRIVEPEMGVLASGLTGRGRLAALNRIVDETVAAIADAAGRGRKAVVQKEAPARAGSSASASEPTAASEPAQAAAAPSRSDLAGRHVVVTAGGTLEPIDPVRFIGNRSTGKMGLAIAEEALDRGAAVTLILGNASVAPPAGALLARVETAAEMQAALRALTPPEGPRFDVLIMAAAVADFRPKSPSTRKVGRGGSLTLELDPTPDLLAETAERTRTATRSSGGRAPVLVGFAAETGSFERVAEKLEAKGVDLLVANDVAEAGSGFGTDTNRVTIYSADQPPEELPLLSKGEVAELLLDRVVIRLEASLAAASTGGTPAGGTARPGATSAGATPGADPVASGRSDGHSAADAVGGGKESDSAR